MIYFIGGVIVGIFGIGLALWYIDSFRETIQKKIKLRLMAILLCGILIGLLMGLTFLLTHYPLQTIVWSLILGAGVIILAILYGLYTTIFEWLVKKYGIDD